MKSVIGGKMLQELPRAYTSGCRVSLKKGVVGADAIFACLGPALEIFSRYSRVEKASGEAVTLKEYLEHVWAAVAREALSTVFRDSDSGSLEPDARLTVIWLWTLGERSTRRWMTPRPSRRRRRRGRREDEDRRIRPRVRRRPQDRAGPRRQS